MDDDDLQASDGGDFMQASDEEYDFEYEDDEDEDPGTVDIENKYYNAKQLKMGDPEEALGEFLGLPAMEDEKGEWGFRGLKQAIKLEFKLRRYKDAFEHYQQLLTYVKSAVTRNHSEKSIDSILNIVEKSSDVPEVAEYVEQFYSRTLECLQAIKNERLWIKTNIKLARFELQRQNYLWLTRKLRELHRLCQKEDGSDDPNKSTALMEIYALEIQMYSETSSNQQLKQLYRRALRLRAAVPHPKIQGVIRECGGKMNLSEENWAEAQVDFFEAFRNYDEAGDGRRIQMLRYLLLTTLLTKSDINPFDSREAKPYMSDERVQTMASLVNAYQRDDMDQYEIILHKSGDLLSDPYIAENMDEVTRNMRTKAVLKVIAPYTRMRLQWLANHLHMTTDEVRDILCFLVQDGRVKGRIDEGNGIFTVTSAPDAARRRAIKRLKDNVKHLGRNLLTNGDGFKPPPDPPDEPASTPSWPKAILERGNVKRKGRRLRGRMAGYRVIPRYRS